MSELRAGARHRAPTSSNGALCLYSERGRGWLPEYTGEDLLSRAKDWYVHYHRDDWNAEDQAPDLHLYYQRSRFRQLAIIGEDWNPPAGPSGRFAISEGFRSLLMSNPTWPDQMPMGMPPERLSTNVGVQTSKRSVGIWFRLASEPTPADDLHKVLQDIDSKSNSWTGFAQRQIRGLAGIKPKNDYRTVVALGYPGSTGSEWLFLEFTLPVGTKRADRWERELGNIQVKALETAPAKASDLVRRTAHIQTLLTDKRLLIFGLGAVGSSLTLLLAKAGVGSIMGVDAEQMRPGNSIRHEAGIRLSGLDKATAMQIVVGQHAPYCDFTTHVETWDPDELIRLAKGADLIVDATANSSFGLLLNEACVRAVRPLLSVATYRRASVGRIRIIKPGENACFVCYLEHAETPDYPLIPPGDEGEFIEAGCGDPTVEASAIDVEFVSNIAAQAARKVLISALPEGMDECLVVVTPLDGARVPLQSVGIHWSRRAQINACEACGEL
ncbi:MAG TPA: ThiF family adenylyltransferase [Fimbriimonadaceae bacterium]